VGEEPEDLIVLTDMGFDAAVRMRDSYDSDEEEEESSEWKGQLAMIREAFQKAGEEVWGTGQGWKPPRIVIWNLRAAFNDFHARSNQDGVLQLSGWSPSMLKALQAKGYNIVSGGTDNHLILVNVRDKGLDGSKVWRFLADKQSSRYKKRKCRKFVSVFSLQIVRKHVNSVHHCPSLF
jgi:hypothetical protein